MSVLAARATRNGSNVGAEHLHDTYCLPVPLTGRARDLKGFLHTEMCPG